MLKIKEFIHSRLKPLSTIQEKQFNNDMGTPFGIASAENNTCYIKYYTDNSFNPNFEFNSPETAITFERQFNINAALYAMECKEDIYVRQHFDYETDAELKQPGMEKKFMHIVNYNKMVTL